MKKRLYVLSVICLLGVAVTGANLYRELKPGQQAEAAYTQIRDQAFPARQYMQAETAKSISGNVHERPDFDVLQAWNPDVVGWLWVPGTDIDYPVVQGPDNDYYLNHTADKVSNKIGSIFMESENQKNFQDEVTILYGHHIRGGRMFSSLSHYKDQSWYEEHSIMYLYTPEDTYQVKLFAGQVVSGDGDGFPIQFADDDQRQAWLKPVLKESTFVSGIVPAGTDRILTLCTCSYEYQNARYAVYGILTKVEIEANES